MAETALLDDGRPRLGGAVVLRAVDPRRAPEDSTRRERAARKNHRRVPPTARVTPPFDGSECQRRFDQFVTPEIPRLARLAGQLALPGDRDDLLQETLLRSYRAIDRFDGRYPRAWLCTIMRNTWRNMLRGHHPVADARDVNRTLDLNTPPVPNDEMDPTRDTFEPGLFDALAALPPAQWAVVSLIDLDGFSYQETASLLNIPLGTVMSRLHRGREKLRHRLVAILMAASLPTVGRERCSVPEPRVQASQVDADSGPHGGLCRTLIRHEPVIVFRFDAEGTILARDGKGLELLGQAAGAGIGQRVFDFHRAEPMVIRHAEHALAGRATTTCLELHGASLAAHQAVIRDESGGVAGVVGVAVFGRVRRPRDAPVAGCGGE